MRRVRERKKRGEGVGAIPFLGFEKKEIGSEYSRFFVFYIIKNMRMKLRSGE